jgi:hypothetical protein
MLPIRLAERLFNDTIDPRTYKVNSRRDLDMTLNNDCAIKLLTGKGVKIINLCGRDVVDGNVKALFSILARLFFQSNGIAPVPAARGRGDPLLL